MAAVLVLLLTAGAWAMYMTITKDRVEAAPSQTNPTDAQETIGESGVPSATGSPTPTVANTTASPLVTQKPVATTTSAKPTPGPGQLYVPRIIDRIGAEADYLLRSVGLVPEHAGPDTNWVLCPVLTQSPPEGTIVDLNSTVTFTTQPDGSGC